MFKLGIFWETYYRLYLILLFIKNNNSTETLLTELTVTRTLDLNPNDICTESPLRFDFLFLLI